MIDDDRVYVSGCTGVDHATMRLADGVEAQCAQALANVAAALLEAGTGFDDVVRVRYIVRDRLDFAPCWPQLRAAFGTARPAATMIVAGLIDPEMRIEIEVTARVPQTRHPRESGDDGVGRKKAIKSSFAPIVDAGTSVLVLGSLPGEASLAAGEYYANPRNGFWRLIGGVVETDLAALPYPDRLTALLAAGVGLWDVVATARRRGSLDAAIRDIAANDLAALVASLPRLRLVAFNGQRAAAIGARRLDPATPRLTLPSSSPAHTMAFAGKAAAWAAARAALKPLV